MTPRPEIVLGLHPSARGFGWALFEDAQSLLHWGTVDIRRDRNETALRRIERMLDRHMPGVLAMEQHDAKSARRSKRVRQLYRAVVRYAETKGIQVRSYSRAEISRARYLRGARTRDELAAAVADHLIVLRPRVPKPRPIWIGEALGMSLFCGAACALTYFASRKDLLPGTP